MKVYPPVPEGAVPDFTHTRPVVIPESLEELRGPQSGMVKLPLHLDWTPSNTYDLSDPGQVRTMYATVLREAKEEDDLLTHLNEQLLRQHWSALRLPRFTRNVWESQHPTLPLAQRRTPDQ